MIENLVETGYNNPHYVIGRYCSWISRDKDGNILPYSKWVRKIIRIGDKGSDVFFGSGGGTLFPVGSLKGANQPYEEIKKVCPLADDIWLNAWIRYNGFEVLNIKHKGAIPNNINLKNSTLSSVNNGQGMNDKQLFSVINYFKEKFDKNSFEK